MLERSTSDVNAFNGTIQTLRFPGDEEPSRPSAPARSGLINAFLLNDLLVQPEVLPRIAALVGTVCDRLGMPPQNVQTFVYASPYFQAECHLTDLDSCIVRLSSSLVEALSEDELMFVIGHELGHFLLRHLWDRRKPAEGDLEELLVSRRRELSVDRVGLLACRSLPAALSAMMKTMSGLSEKHLILDIAGFVSQIRSMESGSQSLQGAMTTHPSFVIRCRAILWFSMNGAFQRDKAPIEQSQIDDINSRITHDLERYLDKPILERIAEAADDFEFWSMASAVTRKGAFTKALQEAFAERFGGESTAKLKTLLGSLTTTDAVSECDKRLRTSQATLEEIAPRRSVQIASALKPKMEAILFGNP